MSTDISLHHVEGKRLDNTVWSLLNFNAYVKYHVKVSCLSIKNLSFMTIFPPCSSGNNYKTLFNIIFCKCSIQTTRGFIQRRMRRRLEGLVEVISTFQISVIFGRRYFSRTKKIIWFLCHMIKFIFPNV